MANILAWQDYFIQIPVSDGVTTLFRVSGGVDEFGLVGVFYQGVAVRKPSDPAAYASINLTPICWPRIPYGAPNFHERTKTAIMIPATFTVETSTDGGATWTGLASHVIYPDWSYGTDAGFNIYRTRQITDHFHWKQVLFHTQTSTPPASVTPWRNDGAGNVNGTAISMSGGGVASLPLAQFCTDKTIAVGFGQLTWRTPNHCAPGALYYRNPFGGWDSFLVEGSILASSDTERWTRTVRVADNTNREARAEQNYVNEIVQRRTLSTGPLTDNESAKMWYLLESPDVWLHDFRTDSVVPVILDDKSQAVKTYKTNGRRVSVYTINCHIARTDIRM
ncbi:MAG: hypothetical protein IJ654_05360 [Bacteroidales bacterium]|nr:hypothetical protein [Bacteroidales bacterium]